MKEFLAKAHSVLMDDKPLFLEFYNRSVMLWIQGMLESSDDDAEVKQAMYSKSKSANFTNMYQRLRVQANADKLGRKN